MNKKIWSIADNVRGYVDGWDFKQYILGILFYRFISENDIKGLFEDVDTTSNKLRTTVAEK